MDFVLANNTPLFHTFLFKNGSKALKERWRFWVHCHIVNYCFIWLWPQPIFFESKHAYCRKTNKRSGPRRSIKIVPSRRKNALQTNECVTLRCWTFKERLRRGWNRNSWRGRRRRRLWRWILSPTAGPLTSTCDVWRPGKAGLWPSKAERDYMCPNERRKKCSGNRLLLGLIAYNFCRLILSVIPVVLYILEIFVLDSHNS